MAAPRSKLAVVAREAGVSVSTVSKVLRAYPDVAPATRARVRDVLRRSGYPSDMVAASNLRRSAALVDVVLTGLGTTWVGEVLTTVGEQARVAGLAVVVTTVSPDRPVPRHWLDQIAVRGTRGVVGLHVDFTAAQLGYLAAHDIPCVLVAPSDWYPPEAAGVTTTLSLADDVEETARRAIAAITRH